MHLQYPNFTAYCTSFTHPLQSFSTINNSSVKCWVRDSTPMKTVWKWKTNKQNENSICTLRAAISQSILPLLPRSFVTERQRDKLQLCSCLVLHKSHWGKFMDDRCSSKWGFFPPLPSSPLSRKGLHGHRQRPGVNLPLCCHGNGRAEKKGRKPGGGSYDPTEWGKRGAELSLSFHV